MKSFAVRAIGALLALTVWELVALVAGCTAIAWIAFDSAGPALTAAAAVIPIALVAVCVANARFYEHALPFTAELHQALVEKRKPAGVHNLELMRCHCRQPSIVDFRRGEVVLAGCKHTGRNLGTRLFLTADDDLEVTTDGPVAGTLRYERRPIA
jgi:hypothetical protein